MVRESVPETRDPNRNGCNVLLFRSTWSIRIQLSSCWVDPNKGHSLCGKYDWCSLRVKMKNTYSTLAVLSSKHRKESCSQCTGTSYSRTESLSSKSQTCLLLLLPEERQTNWDFVCCFSYLPAQDNFDAPSSSANRLLLTFWLKQRPQRWPPNWRSRWIQAMKTAANNRLPQRYGPSIFKQIIWFLVVLLFLNSFPNVSMQFPASVFSNCWVLQQVYSSE